MGGIFRFKCLQVVDRRNAIVEIRNEPPFSIWLSNVDTTAMADGIIDNRALVVVIRGTRTYETVRGSSRTIFEAEPIDIVAIINSHIERNK